MDTASDKFGLLLAHFFGRGNAGLSPAAAAAITGLGLEAAHGALELLESAGILRSRGGTGARQFGADTGSAYYRRSRVAYAIRQRT